MAIVKTFRYAVGADWSGGRVVCARAQEKPPLRIATPPEFKDGVRGIWSPEELVVAAVAACYELTLVAVAEPRRFPVHRLEVSASGHLERGERGYHFTVIELDVELHTDLAHEREADEVALLAKELCIVERALDVPVHVDLTLHVQDDDWVSEIGSSPGESVVFE